MFEIIGMALLVLVAWLVGREQAERKSEAKQKEAYHDTKKRIDSVSRGDGSNVDQRLRDHAD